MVSVPRHRRSLPPLLFAAVVLAAPSALAQREMSPDGSRSRTTPLERACGPALERFCPALAATPGQTRNQVICLKPYRTSLPTYCRAAVSAALK